MGVACPIFFVNGLGQTSFGCFQSLHCSRKTVYKQTNIHLYMFDNLQCVRVLADDELLTVQSVFFFRVLAHDVLLTVQSTIYPIFSS